MLKQSPSRRVKILRDAVARKIAAGEVIDRPCAAVRELMDNAIDAGATSVTVSIEEGGMRSIRVVDDGWGMTKEDLEACYLPHATSKIEEADDIYHISSLGFRGEALSSIAACAELSIASCRFQGETGNRLQCSKSGSATVTPCSGQKGTVVEVRDLFSTIPGRKKFLKRPSAEASMIRQTFLEKALPFPNIWFRLYVDGEMRINLPSAALKERVLAAYPSQTNSKMLFEIREQFEGFAIQGVFAAPSIYRRDRRYIHIYVNNRRVNEFSLIQAVEYGFSSYLPGGTHPLGFLLIEVDPELVDFNIHPAKREVKFKNLQEIHRNTVRSVQAALSQGEEPQSREPSKIKAVQKRRQEAGAYFNYGSRDAQDRSKDSTEAKTIIKEAIKAQNTGDSRAEPASLSQSQKPDTGKNIIYKGQIFNLFLLFEYKGSLYILDQHAAHERLIYNQLTDDSRAPQRLLIPCELDISDPAPSFREELASIGIIIEKKEDVWHLVSVPAACTGTEDVIRSYIEDCRGTPENLKAELFADIACKKAIKDGEVLDAISARELIAQALKLPLPRCPHGRPVWFELSREELFQLLGRT